MRRVALLVLLAACNVGAQELAHVENITTEIAADNSVTFKLDYSGPIAKAGARLECEQVTTPPSDVGKLVSDKPAETPDTLLQFTLAKVSSQVDLLRCRAESTTGGFQRSPRFTVDLATTREVRRQKYSPPSSVTPGAIDRVGKKVTLHARTATPGQVKARIVGDNREVGPTALDFQHTLPFGELEPGKIYQFEIWVVDAGGKAIDETRRTTRDDGTRIQLEMPANTGKPGLTIGRPGADARHESVGTREALINARADRDATSSVRFTKVIDRKAGQYAPGPTREFDLAAGVVTPLKIEGLEPGSEYDYSVVAKSVYGEESDPERGTLSTLKDFSIVEPVEVSFTPVGFIIKVTATEKPDRAGVRLIGDNYNFDAKAAEITSEVVSVALTGEDTKAFLMKFADVKADEKSGVWATVTGKKKADFAVTSWPKLEVYVGKGKQSDTEQLRLTFDTVQSTKAKIQTLNIEQDDKNKLTNAIGKVSNEKWGETWGNVIGAVARIALAAF